ncbi:MAG: AlgP family protein [Pseudomonadaceae bacterium]
MTSTDKPKSTDKVSSPLHLLQTLTRTLNEHLAEACDKAVKDAGKAVEKLQRQQEKLEEKLKQSEEKLAERTAEDPNKAASKTRRKIADLQAALLELKQARKQADSYVAQLKTDVEQTLRLAKGLDRIDTQVTQALVKRDAPKPAAKPRTRRAPAKRKPAAAKPATAAS